MLNVTLSIRKLFFKSNYAFKNEFSISSRYQNANVYYFKNAVSLMADGVGGRSLSFPLTLWIWIYYRRACDTSSWGSYLKMRKGGMADPLIFFLT